MRSYDISNIHFRTFASSNKNQQYMPIKGNSGTFMLVSDHIDVVRGILGASLLELQEANREQVLLRTEIADLKEHVNAIKQHINPNYYMVRTIKAGHHYPSEIYPTLELAQAAKQLAHYRVKEALVEITPLWR